MIQKTAVEIVKNGRSYQLVIDMQAPLGELHDVLMEFKQAALAKMNELQAQETKVQPPPPEAE